ncbi:FlgO family outer membrane protein, partial [Acidobacteriota bacterium]
RTCSNWEKELGLPVHRIDTDSSRSRVFAYTEELDKWLEEKRQNNNFKKTSGRKNRLILTSLFFALTVIIVISALLLTNTISINPSSKRPSIAVIPFVFSNSSDHENYFSEGLTNYVINQLLNLHAYNVFSAAMTEKFRNTQEDIEKIKGELNPKLILSGTLEQNGENLNLNLQFLKAKSNTVIWTIQLEEPEENISDFLNRLQDEMYGKLAKKNTARRTSVPPRERVFNKNTYDIFLKGNYILNKIKTDNGDPWEVYYQGKFYSSLSARESNELAIRLFSKAIEMDSQFALAYFALAKCYTNYINFAWENKIEWLEKAAQRGKVNETLRIIENLKVVAVEEQQMSRRDLNFASMYFGIGEIELGLKYLKSFFSYPEIAERKFRYLKEIEIDRNFDKVRQDERFIKEIERIRAISN